jgi:NAD(P)-dependent dehydrogenase (short-subunit alcohol dehydrogenase family)
VWLVVRDAARGEEAASGITGEVRVGLCDLSRLDSVRAFAALVSQVDVLVHNAGVLTESRELTADGIELTLATNVIGPFLLTALLVPALRASGAGRVITVSSGGMYTARLDVDALGSQVGARAYAQTKRAQVVLSELWAARLRDTGIVVHSMHPGWVDTPGLRSSLPGFYRGARRVLRTPAEGADTIVWLGAADEPGRVTGRFWHDRRERPTYVLPGTRESEAQRERLWAECVRLSGAAPGTP